MLIPVAIIFVALARELESATHLALALSAVAGWTLLMLAVVAWTWLDSRIVAERDRLAEDLRTARAGWLAELAWGGEQLRLLYDLCGRAGRAEAMTRRLATEHAKLRQALEAIADGAESPLRIARDVLDHERRARIEQAMAIN